MYLKNNFCDLLRKQIIFVKQIQLKMVKSILLKIKEMGKFDQINSNKDDKGFFCSELLFEVNDSEGNY